MPDAGPNARVVVFSALVTDSASLLAARAIPSWIKVKSGPGEAVQMEKTFYPDSGDCGDSGLFTATEMPMHTVPGSFGTYEHVRYTTYRIGEYITGRGVGLSALTSITRGRGRASPASPSTASKGKRVTERDLAQGGSQ